MTWPGKADPGRDFRLRLASNDPYAWVFIMHREPLSGDLLASRPYCQWRSPKFIITFFPATEGDEKLSCDDGKSGS